MGQPRLAFGVRDLPRDVVERGRAHATGRRSSGARVFSVHVESERAAPILGDYRAVEGALWLLPSFPPERGVRYLAVFQPAALAGEAALRGESATAPIPHRIPSAPISRSPIEPRQRRRHG